MPHAPTLNSLAEHPKHGTWAHQQQTGPGEHPTYSHTKARGHLDADMG